MQLYFALFKGNVVSAYNNLKYPDCNVLSLLLRSFPNVLLQRQALVQQFICKLCENVSAVFLQGVRFIARLLVVASCDCVSVNVWC